MSTGRSKADDVELNLMDEDGDHEVLSLEDPDAAEESAFAVQEFTRLPFASQEQVRNILRNSEKLQFVEKPSRWRSNIALISVSIVGTLVFIILLFFLKKVNSNIIVVLATFPLALIAAAYSIYRGEQRFFVLTNQRLIAKPGWGDTTVVEFSALEAVSIRYNWLALMPELEVKHILPDSMAPRRRSALSRGGEKRMKTDYVDSVEHLEAYRRFLQSEIESYEEVVEEYD